MQGEKQIRTLKCCEIRAEEADGNKYIYGFIPYNQKSQKMWLGYTSNHFEVMAPTVFNKTLGDKANVYANFSHDDLKILGSTDSGTLTLATTEDGLECRCKVPNTSWGNDAWELVSNKIVTTMSFEFTPYDWVEDYEPDTTLLRSAKLTAVSFCVAYPAYLGTDSFSALRTLCKDVDLEKVEKADKEEIQKLIRELSGLIDDKAETEKESVSPEQTEEKEVIQTEEESRSDNAEKEVADADAEKAEAEANEKAKRERERLALELELSLSLSK